MKFLCLAYEEEKKLNALSMSEWNALRDETLAYVDELRKTGRIVSAEALQSVRTGATVRVRDDRVAVTDGPFAETKEQLGGFFLINARDLNEAVEVASRWPSARFGSIEVRPIEEELREDGRYVEKQGH
ncbi:MAG: YciI family protein [bacterium]